MSPSPRSVLFRPLGVLAEDVRVQQPELWNDIRDLQGRLDEDEPAAALAGEAAALAKRSTGNYGPKGAVLNAASVFI